MVRLFCTFVIHFIRKNFAINKFFPFSTYFISNMILQCMTTYFSLKKANLVMLSVWIRPNIAANTKNPGVSRNHEKSFYLPSRFRYPKKWTKEGGNEYMQTKNMYLSCKNYVAIFKKDTQQITMQCNFCFRKEKEK